MRGSARVAAVLLKLRPTENGSSRRPERARSGRKSNAELPERESSVNLERVARGVRLVTVSYTHLRAHETVLDIVCRLLLEKNKKNNNKK